MIQALPLSLISSSSDEIKKQISYVLEDFEYSEYAEKGASVLKETIELLKTQLAQKIEAEQASEKAAVEQAKKEAEKASRQIADDLARDILAKEQAETAKLLKNQQEEIDRQKQALIDAEKVLADAETARKNKIEADKAAEVKRVSDLKEKEESDKKAAQEQEKSRIAEEKQAKQRAEDLKNRHDELFAATISDMKGYKKREDFLDAIISGQIRNLKWSPE